MQKKPKLEERLSVLSSDKNMALVNTLVLLNPLRPECLPVVVAARVTKKAMHLVIPDSIRKQLGLDTMATREVVLDDGREYRLPYVGPVEIRANGCSSVTGALVMGDEVILGNVALDDVTP